MFRITALWESLLKEKGALWIHDGNPKRPHVTLRSKKHSSGFFKAKLVTEDDALRKEAVCDLLQLLIESGLSIYTIDRVVGPATGATKLAKSLAEEITRLRGYECGYASPIKVGKDGVITMVFDDPEHTVQPGEIILLIEDVLTTGGSVVRTEEAVIALGGTCFKRIAVIVNRSGLLEVDGKRIIALVKRKLTDWDNAEVCALCQAGSAAIDPKVPAENWTLLNADY